MYIILGGGATGLTILECLLQNGEKRVNLVTDQIGGQYNDIYTGPRILHYGYKCKQFLKNIGVSDEHEQFRVGYIHDNGHINNTYSEYEWFDYFYKTRGDKAKKFQKSCMSGGSNIILGWDWGKINLLDRLYRLNKQYVDIMPITKEHIESWLKRGYRIISTLPINVLYQILGIPCVIKFGNILFAQGAWIDNRYSYFYDLRLTSMVRRVMPVSRTEAVYEFVQDATTSDVYNVLGSARKIHKADYQILQDLNIEGERGVEYEGRLAQVNHSYKMNTAIEKFLEVQRCKE